MESNDIWHAVVKKILPAIVVLNVAETVDFEGNHRSNGSATGFIIDKGLGLILTNRHVITGGPGELVIIYIYI